MGLLGGDMLEGGGMKYNVSSEVGSMGYGGDIVMQQPMAM